MTIHVSRCTAQGRSRCGHLDTYLRANEITDRLKIHKEQGSQQTWGALPISRTGYLIEMRLSEVLTLPKPTQ